MGAGDVIGVEGLRRAYRDTPAVQEVSFAVRPGEIFGLLGPNGAGKTTTVEILQGLRHRDGGTVQVLGLDPGTDANRLRRRIGSQLQSAALPDRLRVGEAVALFGSLQPRPVDVAGVLRTWQLRGLRRRAFATLSGGQRQRLFLALALLGEPEVVFLDELTAALDPAARRATWNLVRGLRDQGTTIVLVTHFMEEAEALCDRLAIMDRGRIVAQGRVAELTARSDTGVRVTFSSDEDHAHLLAEPGVAAVKATRGQVTVTGDAEVAFTVAAALAARNRRPADFRVHHPSLEDVFLELTGRSLTDAGDDAD